MRQQNQACGIAAGTRVIIKPSIWLQSADPLAAPMIDTNFLREAEDLETMVAGFKTTRRLMETPALRALQKKDMFTSDVRTDDIAPTIMIGEKTADMIKAELR